MKWFGRDNGGSDIAATPDPAFPGTEPTVHLTCGRKRSKSGIRLSRMFMPATLRSSTRRLGCPSLAQATLIVIVAGLLWRTVRYALAFPLWGDEAFVAVNFLTRDLAGLTRPLEYFQIAPPGFLLAEWLAVHVFGTGERALRLVPYLAGVASLLLFWRFCREVASRRTVLLAVAMLAASFFPVRHSTEVKPYAIDLLVSLTLITAGWAVGRDIRSHRAWLALFGFTIAGVWCSYAAVFPAAGVALFLGAKVVRERSSRLVALWLTYGLLMTLSWGIMFVTFADQQARAAALSSAPGNLERRVSAAGRAVAATLVAARDPHRLYVGVPVWR